MLLTFDRGYKDYSDESNWLPRLKALKNTADQTDIGQLQQLSDRQLQNTMELLEELILYYCYQKDFSSLEPVMRKFYAMLKHSRTREIKGVEQSYLEAVFQQINAKLYFLHNRKKQAAEEYEKCIPFTRTCFDQVKAAEHLTPDQLVYVGWSCIRILYEAVMVYDELLENAKSHVVCQEILPMLYWLCQHLSDTPGICDQAAELYVKIGSNYYLAQEAPIARMCFQRAIQLYSDLGSDFYCAKAIWTHCNYGILALTYEQDSAVLLECERKIGEYLRTRAYAEPRDRAIVQAAQGMILYQKAFANDPQQEKNLMEEAVKYFSDALSVLENIYRSSSGYTHDVLFGVAAKIYCTYVVAMYVLGTLYYQKGETDLAEGTFGKVQNLLTNSTAYSLNEGVAIFLRAGVNQYMAMFASDKGDFSQTEFYGVMAADEAYDLGEQTGMAEAWIIAVTSCCMMAEIYLNVKDKPKALQFAEKGLDACDKLEAISPNEQILTLRSSLNTFRKKASRRFF